MVSKETVSTTLLNIKQRIENMNCQNKQLSKKLNSRANFPRDALARRLDTAIQSDCGLNFKLRSKKTAGLKSLLLTENFDTKHAGYSSENKAESREILRLFCSGTEQELRDMSAFLFGTYFIV